MFCTNGDIRVTDIFFKTKISWNKIQCKTIVASTFKFLRVFWTVLSYLNSHDGYYILTFLSSVSVDSNIFVMHGFFFNGTFYFF